jgi:hypothetical protein
VIAAVMIAGLAAYVIPKRFARRVVREKGMRREERAPRSRVKGALRVHVVIGLLAPAFAIAHAARVGASAGGALMAALLGATVLGGFGAAVYRAIPRRLTRLERTGTLPEDLEAEGEEARARLFAATSGKGEKVKRLAEKLVLPYARAPLGWLALIASGRSIAEEEARLAARIERALEGRMREEAAPLVRIAVAQRALTARRVLGAALRGWMPMHIVASAVVVALLVVHVVVALW